MRLFVCATLPALLREQLVAAQRALARGPLQLSATDPQQLHLTLRFIGEVDEALAGQLRATFRALPAAPHAARLAQQLDYGSFPGRNGWTLWAGLAVDEALVAWRARLEASLDALGLEAERRAWRPHVTLARRVRPKPESAALSALPRHRGPLELGALQLVHSQLSAQGSQYSVVEELAFEAPTARG